MSLRHSTNGARQRLVVAYYRMSSEKQEKSIADQRAAVHGYAGRCGLRIVREYQDDGISGDLTEKRAGFQQMIAECAHLRDVEAVLCWDQDRFGRFDPLEAGYWIKPLRDVGVRLETVATGAIDWDNFAGRIGYVVQQEGKHAFLRDLSRNTLRGMLRAAREGYWLGGKPPYGYRAVEVLVPGCRRPPKRLVPGDPVKVEVVRWIFNSYASREVGVRRLADELNRRGVPSPAGGRWQSIAVRDILTRREYVGDRCWNRRRWGSYHGVQGGQIEATRKQARKGTNRREDWQLVEGTHPAIIDRGLWETVQAKLVRRRNAKSPRAEAPAFLLSGLLVCGHCGYRMIGQSNEARAGRTRYRPYRRYLCSGYHNQGASVCRRHTIDEAPAVLAIVNKLCATLLSPDGLRAYLAELKARVRADREAAKRRYGPAERAKLRERVAELEKEIAEGVRRLRSIVEALLPAYQEELLALQTERERLRRELSLVEGAGREQEAELDCLVEADMANLAQLREALLSGDPEAMRIVLVEAVDKVELWWEQRPTTRRREKRTAFVRGLIHPRLPGKTVPLTSSDGVSLDSCAVAQHMAYHGGQIALLKKLAAG
jgi:DNA invertase Pin-like site-specific DNA recombinase